MMKKIKLKTLLEDIDNDKYQKFDPEQKKMIMDMVKKYNSYGADIKRAKPLNETSVEISKIMKYAEHLLLSEIGDWFDKKTIEKNAKELRKIAEDFSTIAKEASTLEQRLYVSFEDARHLLSRYFDLEESDITKL